MIHPTAQVDPGARLGARVSVGAYSIIGPDVDIGDGSSIGPHCVITGPTRIGDENRIHSHAVIGGDPQDKKYAGERTELVIGHRNSIFEFTTIRALARHLGGDGPEPSTTDTETRGARQRAALGRVRLGRRAR